MTVSDIANPAYRQAIKAEAKRIAFDVEEYLTDRVAESVERHATGGHEEVAEDLLAAVREELARLTPSGNNYTDTR